MSPRALLVRGMLAGALAGLAALTFAAVLGEPQVAAAVRWEEAHTAPAHTHAEQPVSRAIQATLGLGVAIVLFGVAVGAVFGLVFGFAYGRIGGVGPRGTALAVAAVGFIATILVPFLRFPANPPGVGEAESVNERTGLYFLMLVISLATAVGAVIASRALEPRLGAWNAAIVAVAGFLAVIATTAALLPDAAGTGDEVAEFPADLLWRFRLAVLGTQAVLWTALGLVFGALSERRARHPLGPRSLPQPAP